jgi:DNA repair exonuclease SbcCD ATPase subunit
LRVVEINPKGRVIQITGKNGQGKSSVIDAIWAGLVGSKAIPEKPVRRGAQKAKIKIDLGEFKVIRTINEEGGHTLTVENAKGTKVTSPQAMLDGLLGELTFDPLGFIAKAANETTPMLRKRQIETLRKVAKIELDIDALNAADAKDYESRTQINRDIKQLEVEVAGITVQEGLPKEKLSEADVLAKLQGANAENQAAQEQFKAKQRLSDASTAARRAIEDNNRAHAQIKDEMVELEAKLIELRLLLEQCEKAKINVLLPNLEQADKAYADAPAGELVDVTALTQELQTVQLTNREIDKRSRREDREKQLRLKRQRADSLTRAIEDRTEQKRTAMQTATMPVAGLTFDENNVMFNGIPIDQLGEGEQIRISTAIAMAANPDLRILRILHGEALDDDSLAILAEMAEANDFQIWMAKVDSSGRVGIVMEDGMAREAE